MNKTDLVAKFPQFQISFPENIKNSDTFFKYLPCDGEMLYSLVHETKPNIIIDVSLFGNSTTAAFAHCLKTTKFDSTILCVNGDDKNFLGPAETLLALEAQRLLSNVAASGAPEVCLASSVMLSEVCAALKNNKICCELGFVGSEILSAGKENIFDKMCDIWKCLSSGGILFGNSFGGESVKINVQAFAAQFGHPVMERGQYWIIRKRS